MAAAIRLHRARHRRAEGRTLLEGPHLLATATAAATAVETVFALADDRRAAAEAGRAGAEFVPVTREVLDRLAPTEHPRGPVAIIRVPPARPPSGGDALVLWGIADPGNAGTMLRTAVAFGLEAVTAGDGVDPWSPKVLRAAAGAHFTDPPARLDPASVPGLRSLGLVPVAAVVAGGDPPDLLPVEPVAVLIGSEAGGLPDDVVAACDVRVTIPSSGVESLNAAAAAAVLAYEAARRR